MALLRYKGDLRGIERARRLLRATVRNMWQTVFRAFAYNAAGVPFAAGVLYPFGVLLSPILAAAAISSCSVSVVVNPLRLRSRPCHGRPMSLPRL